jgi:hypothetical protein
MTRYEIGDIFTLTPTGDHMRTFQTWSDKIPMETIEAETGYDARKAFAAKHNIPAANVMARWLSSEPVKLVSPE